MASGYDRIAEAFRLLASVEFPPHFLELAELRAVNAHAKAVKARQASELLVTKGAALAAAECGCCRATIYNRAEKHRRKRELATD